MLLPDTHASAKDGVSTQRDASSQDSTHLGPLDRALVRGPNTLLAPPEAAIALHTSPATLARWRMQGAGPAFVRQSSNRVHYRAQDLADYLGAKRVSQMAAG